MIIYEILKFRVSLSIVERSKVRYIYIVIKLYKSIPYFFIKIIKVLLKLNGFINFILLRTTSMVNSVKKRKFFQNYQNCTGLLKSCSNSTILLLSNCKLKPLFNVFILSTVLLSAHWLGIIFF